MTTTNEDKDTTGMENVRCEKNCSDGQDVVCCIASDMSTTQTEHTRNESANLHELVEIHPRANAHAMQHEYHVLYKHEKKLIEIKK